MSEETDSPDEESGSDPPQVAYSYVKFWDESDEGAELIQEYSGFDIPVPAKDDLVELMQVDISEHTDEDNGRGITVDSEDDNVEHLGSFNVKDVNFGYAKIEYEEGKKVDPPLVSVDVFLEEAEDIETD